MQKLKSHLNHYKVEELTLTCSKISKLGALPFVLDFSGGLHSVRKLTISYNLLLNSANIGDVKLDKVKLVGFMSNKQVEKMKEILNWI